MAHLASRHWNTRDGVCTLHGLPSVPCPACVAEKNKDLELVISELDYEMISWGETSIDDICPGGFAGFQFSYISISDNKE